MKQLKQSDRAREIKEARKREKDYIGRTVVLLVEVRSKNGLVFPKGSQMRICGAWRGRYHLHDLTPRLTPTGDPMGIHVRHNKFIVVADEHQSPGDDEAKHG